MQRIITKKAFTLIELLVVVSIIALLVSILLPSLSKARELAKAAACMSNLKQLGITTQCYVNEYNGYLPPRKQDSMTSTSGYRYWPSMLTTAKLLDSRDVFYCPSWKPRDFNESVEVVRQETGQPDMTHDEAWFSVQYTYGMRDWVTPSGEWEAKKATVIAQPFDFFLIGDSYCHYPGHSMDTMQGYIIGLGNTGTIWRAHVRHSQKANLLFADLHVDREARSYFENMRNTWQVEYMTQDARYRYYVWPEE